MLLVSIRDVSPDTLDDFMSLRQMVENACGGRVTLLVAPDSKGRHHLNRCPRSCEVLMACAALGDEIALYGATEPAPLDNIFDANARWLADLDWRALDAEHRLRDARHALEDALAVPIEGFGGPAFFGCAWITTVLRECGFRWHADSRWIDELPSQRRLCSAIWETPAISRELEPVSRSILRRVTLGPEDLRRPTLKSELEYLGRAYGPSRSTMHMLQTERRGVPIPPQPGPIAIGL